MTDHRRGLRADQLLSRFGYCSRSEARRWIRDGRVTVEGVPVPAPEQRLDPARTQVDGQPVECPNGLLALLHKPAGCVCSHERHDGPSVYDRLPARWQQRNPVVTSVGRLDQDTTGVLLLTDVGALVQRWTSPRHKVVKIYEATVNRDLSPALIPLFASGELRLEAGESPCRPAQLEIVNLREARLHLIEGRYHQVKRMFASQGYEVTRLHRSQFGEFTLDGLAPGEWRMLPIEPLLEEPA